MTLATKYSKYNVPQLFVEMLLLQNKPWLVRYKKIRAISLSCQGMVRNGMEDDFSIFHTGNFLPFHFHSILKIFHSIFHSILKFPSILHFILPYQGKFKPEATRNLYCIFATLSVPLQVVAREGKQYGTMHLIPYLKDYRNQLP